MRAMAYAHHPNTSVIVGTEHTPDGNIPASSGETSKPKINVKVPKTLSEFPLSPFELGLDHAGVPRMKRATAYDWLNQNDFPGSHLERYWINHTVPWPICITGHVARACLLQFGNFTVEFCDFVMRLWSHMDDVIYKHAEQYGKAHKRWRHFLAASFEQSVTSQEDYLSCPRTRSMFIGDHINYKIEYCQMIILPVMSNGKWSCYFWDFKYKTATVVDPTLMKSNSVKVKSHHQDTLADLHKALFECIEHFLTEWDVDENDWEFSFPDDSGPRARAFNSGLYAVHYARAFDG
ncbi:uncharacterized protein C2845_PM07G17050 [Panicum miliaceum]|uniref:Ubiquitin-like protease family profile domain-containing protein n=1 Tax=Panicum miliaceum TaxID=4540 RepID=A0A3L6SJ41_PANMI|nr:uncharacterized protein C2845_PM07G17050 [Panicum miliaceum]